MKAMLIAAALSIAAAPALAKDYTVKLITDPDSKQIYRFEPANLKLQAGDTVRFIDAQDDMHDVMFEKTPKSVAMAMSPMLEHKGQSWSYTFTAPGVYEYHCHPHEALGMHGVIMVE